MASLALQQLVAAVICHVAWSVQYDQSPVCLPVCENGVCPAKIDPIDIEECNCRWMLRDISGDAGFLTLNYTQNHVEILFPKGFVPGGEAMLYVPVTKEKKGDWVKPLCYGIARGNGSDAFRIKLKCSRHLDLSFNSTIALNKQRVETFNPNTPRVSTDHMTVPKLRGDVCDCWSPDKVKIHLTDNSTMMVQWYPFYGHDDLLVRVEEASSSTRRYKDTKLRNSQVCIRRMLNFTFTDFQPGTYVAMVNAVGCDCKTKSDPITIDKLTVPEPVLKTNIMSTHKEEKQQVPMAVVLIVVGAAACISLLALGLTLMIRRYQPGYQIVRQNITAEVTETQQNANDRGVEDISTHLKPILRGSNIMVITTPTLETNRTGNELELLVSLDDVNSVQSAPITSSKHRLKILMNHMVGPNDPESPLMVYVPRECPHPAFRRRNNSEDSNSVLSMREFLQRIKPSYDFTSRDYEQFVKCARDVSRAMKDRIQKFFLISGRSHDHHVNACFELKRMIQELGHTVKYVQDDTNRQDLREEGEESWAVRQLRSTDLVLVVGSEYLYELIKREYCADLYSSTGSCAKYAMTLLSRNRYNTRIAYLSFGYESVFIDKIENISNVTADMRYDLTPTSGWTGQGEHSPLEIFLSRLSSDRDLVHRVCAGSEGFKASVRNMMELTKTDRRWLRERFPSLDCVISVDACSVNDNNHDSMDEMETRL